jgi:NAD(P)-dependent dehydrogenase (short-subunit alcohol dehydrogenase family)
MSAPTDRALTGRTALVVGGAGALGRAVCADLARRGANVAVGYRSNESQARSIAAGIEGAAIAVPIDIDSDESIDEAYAEIEDRLGRVGVLVNTAHPDMAPRALAELGRSDLTLQLNAAAGHVAVCRRALPGMREAHFGRIVYVSGALMSRPAPGFGAYGAAKAAATAATRYLALEEGRAGITANIVAPGRIIDSEDDLDAERDELSRVLLARTALGAFPTLAEVARTIGWLGTSSELTGQTLWVTGGEPILA